MNATDASVDAPPVVGWRRHPSDVVRLVLSLAVALVTLALTAFEPDSVRRASGDLVVLVRRLPAVVTEALLGVVQLSALVLPIAAVVALAAGRHWRSLVTAAVAAIAAAETVVLLQGWLDRVAPPELVVSDSWVTGSAFPSGAYLAGLAAAVMTVLPTMRRPWRRALVAVVAVFAIVRVLTAVVIPFHVVTHLAIGAAVGSALLVALGSPVRRIPLGEVATALAATGLPVGHLAEVSAAGERTRRFRTVDAAVSERDGTEEPTPLVVPAPLVVDVLGVDERNADLLDRVVRLIRFKGIDDDRPGWSPERVVQHEALCTLAAARAGVPTAAFEAVSVTASGDGVLAFRDDPDVLGVDEIPPDEIGDEVLGQLWRAVSALHRRRIAHRWLSPRHVAVRSVAGPDESSVVLLRFRWARLAADDTALDIDLANALVGVATVVGAERAVRSAIAALPADRVAAALPYLQPPLLTPDVRALVRSGDLLAEVVTAIRDATGAESVELAELRRISVANVVGWIGAAFLVYVLLSFVSNWSAISDALGRADWGYVPILLVLSALSYPAGAMSLLGAVPVRLPVVETNQVMLAQTYLNRFTPANAGGMALRARYLQRHGLELPSAATSIGLTSAASGAMQVLLLVVFGVWAGRSVSIGFDLPSADVIALAVVAVLVLAGVAYATPWGRRVLFGRLRTTVGRVVADVREVARRPGRLGLLFGGALLAKLVTILAFTQACRMVGIDEAFPVLALLFMTANTVASAAPTPGGLGAIEAALVVVLQGVGVGADDALAAVLLFRVATYWLPTLPSWVMLRVVQHRGIV